MEEYHLKNLSAKEAKRILECADQKNIDIEKLIDFINKKKEVDKMTDQSNEEKRFSKEEKIVEKYIKKRKSQGIEISYREAVLACLDKTEETKKEEFTEEEKQYIEEQKEDVKKVEEYLEENPKIEYREAVKIVLNKDELNENEKKVEEYIEKRKSQGIEVTYREAVLTVLDSSEGEGSAEDQEIINMHTTINDLIYSLGKAEKSSVFKTGDKSKIKQALDLIVEVKESLQKLIDKKGGSEPKEE